MTKKDLDVQTFRSGGKGGQKQNSTDSGVRIRHRDSGAVGEARDSRSQHQNRKAAFERMVATDTFQRWVKLEAARKTGEIDRWLKEQMKPKYIKVETYTPERKADG